MKQITEQMIKERLDQMAVERELFGRHLLYPEYVTFWNAQKPKSGLRQRLFRAVWCLGVRRER